MTSIRKYLLPNNGHQQTLLISFNVYKIWLLISIQYLSILLLWYLIPDFCDFVKSSDGCKQRLEFSTSLIFDSRLLLINHCVSGLVTSFALTELLWYLLSNGLISGFGV